MPALAPSTKARIRANGASVPSSRARSTGPLQRLRIYFLNSLGSHRSNERVRIILQLKEGRDRTLSLRAENTEGLPMRNIIEMHRLKPEYRERDKRVAVMDAQGVERALGSLSKPE